VYLYNAYRLRKTSNALILNLMWFNLIFCVTSWNINVRMKSLKNFRQLDNVLVVWFDSWSCPSWRRCCYVYRTWLLTWKLSATLVQTILCCCRILVNVSQIVRTPPWWSWALLPIQHWLSIWMT